MIKLKRIKGVTLIEVLVLLSLVILTTLLFVNMDMSVDEKQNARKVGTQMNMIVSAIDKRISIEGKSFSYWKNGTSWNNGAEFRNFLRQELVGKDNTVCGDPAKGWNPAVNLDGLDPTKDEGKSVSFLHSEALSTKLVPCSLWNIYPYNVIPTAKITQDAKNNLANVLISFRFGNIDDWKKGFSKFNESYIFAKEQKNTTLLTQKEFYYSDLADKKIDFKSCLNLKEQCVLNLKVSVGSSATDDKKFKVDSSNSFETNLGFAKSIKSNEQINCNIWIMDASTYPATWSSRQTACGVTGGTNGDMEVGLIGDNIDAENIKITGRCTDYDQAFSAVGVDAECGMINTSTIVQLNTNNIQATKIVAQNVYANEAYLNNLSVKDNSTVQTNFTSVGQSLEPMEDAKSTLTTTQRNTKENIDLFNPEYRPTPAEVSMDSKGLLIKTLKADVEAVLQSKIISNSINITDKVLAYNPILSKALTVTVESTFAILNSGNISDVTDLLTVKDAANLGSVKSTKDSVILGDLTANDIKASGTISTEQLNFRTKYTSNSMLNFSKSINVDGLNNKYVYPDGYIAGWGEKGYLSNSGIFAKKFKLHGNLVLNSNMADTPARTTDDIWGFYDTYTGYRPGIELTYQFPDTRSMFYMNDAGKVMSSGYYDTGANSGIRIGSRFFWGRDPKNLAAYNDKPIYANLSSSIYGYNPGDNITALNNGYKFIANNLTINNTYPANLYSGAYYHGGLPKQLYNQSQDVPINYITNGVGVYWETADGIYLRHLNSTIAYYLNRISYIYGLYVNINKQGTIKGSKGDRGSRGEAGITGIKGITGNVGIPGPVGLRGGTL